MKTYSFKVSKTIKAPRKKVFARWSDPQSVKGFIAPDGCEVKLFKAVFKVGGKFQLKMKTPHGMMANSGQYLEIIPHKRIMQTFVWDAPDTEVNIITIDFEDQGKDTLMTMVGSYFSVKDEAAGNRDGWSSSVDNFAKSFA